MEVSKNTCPSKGKSMEGTLYNSKKGEYSNSHFMGTENPSKILLPKSTRKRKKEARQPYQEEQKKEKLATWTLFIEHR